jgi:hypothetical protein
MADKYNYQSLTDDEFSRIYRQVIREKTRRDFDQYIQDLSTKITGGILDLLNADQTIGFTQAVEYLDGGSDRRLEGAESEWYHLRQVYHEAYPGLAMSIHDVKRRQQALTWQVIGKRLLSVGGVDVTIECRSTPAKSTPSGQGNTIPKFILAEVGIGNQIGEYVKGILYLGRDDDKIFFDSQMTEANKPLFAALQRAFTNVDNLRS